MCEDTIGVDSQLHIIIGEIEVRAREAGFVIHANARLSARKDARIGLVCFMLRRSCLESR